MKIKLTQSIISKGLHCPPDRRGIEYVDAAQPGLYILCRRDSDIQSYFLRYTNRLGKTAHLLLGRVAEMTLKEARYRAKEERAKIREGADPRADIKAINDRPTLTEFYFSTYLPRIKLRNRSWKSADLIFKKRLQPKWGDRRLDTITKAEAESYLSELLSEGNAPATADHVIKTLRNILSVAVSYEPRLFTK